MTDSFPTFADSSDVTLTLLGAIPERLTHHGARTLRRVLRQVLPKLSLTLTPDRQVAGLNPPAWKRIWIALLQARDSYGSHRRYHKLLLEVAQAWREAGLIEALPELPIPSQHPRRLSLHIDKLAGYRYSDYTTLVQTFVDEVTGKGRQLVSPSLREQGTAWLALTLILSGWCTSGAVQRLTELTWADVPMGKDLPMQRPNRERQGWVWHGLTPLARLMLLATYYRRGCPDRTERVFAATANELRQGIHSVLGEICRAAHIPAPSLAQLMHYVRLDLRQVLTNLELSVLTGLVPTTSVPLDQVETVLHELQQSTGGPTSSEPTTRPERQESQVAGVSSPPDAVSDSDATLASYDRYLAEIMPFLKGIFDAGPSKRQRQALEMWIQATPTAENAALDIARFNLGWLVRWLTSLLEDRKLKPASRRLYWSAGLRLLVDLPDALLFEIDQSALAEVLEEHPNITFRAAWKRLWCFLVSAGLPMQPISWNKLTIQPRADPARFLTAEIQAKLLSTLRDTDLSRAFYLGRQAGLRVSEVSRLLTSDIDLSPQGRPYLIVSRSKRGRSRRVPLDNLPAVHLRRLRSYLAEHARETPYFLPDGDKPLDPKRISERMHVALEDAGVNGSAADGRALRFHDGRVAKAEAVYQREGDIRAATLVLGHALVATTVRHYMRNLDLGGVVAMKKWPSPVNRTDLCIPTATLAVLLGLATERVTQWVKERNMAHATTSLRLLKPSSVMDGARPARRGISANYLRVSSALRLVVWATSSVKRLPHPGSVRE